MNYGKEFIKLYNKEFSLLKKEIITMVEKDYDSPKMNNALLHEYKQEIEQQIYDLKKNDSKRGTSSSLTGISLGLMNKEYKFDRIQNIINLDVQEHFVSRKEYSQYDNFTHFLQIYSKVFARINYNMFLSDYDKDFYLFFNERNITGFFNISYKNNGLNSLKKHQVEAKKIENHCELISLTQNEKMIILHVLIHYTTIKKYEIPNTECFRILSLCASGLEEGDFNLANTNSTKFNYFNKGVLHSSKFKGDKRIMVEKIIEKLEGLKKIDKFINALKRYKTIEI
jgi:hypothetical protein